jgi:hypothetical protein
MPLYPLLLSLVVRPGMTEVASFLAAKYFNLFLSMLLLAGLAVVCFRRFPALPALNLTLIVAFSVFVYKAGWVQAELIFYFLNTCLFLLMWRLLTEPDYRWAVAAGIAAALAHLTKASLWPGLILFAVFGILRGGAVLVQRRRTSGAGPAASAKALIVVSLSRLPGRISPTCASGSPAASTT